MSSPASRTREEAFFGFAPAELFDDVFNCAEDYNCNGCDELEKEMLKELCGAQAEGDEEAKVELKKGIAEGVDRLNNFLAEQIDANLEKLELWASSNVLLVPPAVELPGEAVGGGAAADGGDDRAAGQDRLRETQRRLHAARFVRERLRRERDALDRDLARYEREARAGIEAVGAAGLGPADGDAAGAERVPRAAAMYAELRAAGERLGGMDVDAAPAASEELASEETADATFARDCAGAPDGVGAFARSMAV